MMIPDFLAAHLARQPSVSTIPAGTPFLEELVSPIITAYREDPLSLSDLTIFLPNRRAARRVAALFADDAGEDGAAILPRIRTLGDIDEADLHFSGVPAELSLDLAPPADATERRLYLARLVHAKEKALGRSADWPTALMAADTLGQFLDGLHRDEVPFSALQAFAPEDLEHRAAQHWQEQLAFLEIIGRQWPDALAARGWMEAAERRSLLLSAMGDAVLADQDGPPIILAGALGTAQATARFMANVASSPRGHVVLPGLDLALDDHGWSRIEASHPQSVFRDWIEQHLSGIPRYHIPLWSDYSSTSESRRQFLSLSLRPAEATDSWYEGFSSLQASGELKKACNGLQLIEAETSDEEAALISLALREALETPHKTAMLVTPDRSLARRVCAKLRAWGIYLDDAGGTPLTGTFRGNFLRACAAWLCAPSNSTALMQLLNHELSGWGQSVDVSRRVARLSDKVLRGPQFPDWSAVEAYLRAELDEIVGVEALLVSLSEHLEAFAAQPSMQQKILILIEFAEWMSSTSDIEGALRLWRYEDGEELASRLEGLLRAEGLPEDVPDSRFPEFFDALLGSGVMRRRGVGHPRLSVFGLVEARLQAADLTILAGLNEGVWPDGNTDDAYLSRTMRQQLGLASPDQEIGRAANDFEQHAARPEVILTRSERQGSSPSNPSRWWVRIESFLRAGKLLDNVNVTNRYRSLRDYREHSILETPITPPLPKPPAEMRPREFRVTEVSKLIRDPYAIYARRILKLRKWNQRDEAIGYATRGNVIHDLYKALFDRDSFAKIDNLTVEVRDVLPDIFRLHRVPSEQHVLWRRALGRALSFYTVYEQTVRMEGAPALAEIDGTWLLNIAGDDVTIIGRPDRIDQLTDKSLSIVDFKTGAAPTMKQEGAFDPQLSLLALMAMHNAFGELGQRKVARIAYLPVLQEGATAPIFGDLTAADKDKPGALSGAELADHLVEIEGRIRALLKDVISGERPFPSQIYPMRVGDEGNYDHLARRGEWAVRGAAAEGEGHDD